MKNYFINVVKTLVVFMAVVAMCYIWQEMPWYNYTDETLDFIVCILGAAGIVTVVVAVVNKIRAIDSKWKLVIRIERKESVEK